MNELSLFSGAGGGLLGTKLLGWRAIGYVEFNKYCQQIIKQRIKDGLLENAPIYGDIRAFNSEGYARSYKGMVDVITAGFPCQPFSTGGKQLGDKDPRNMWPATIDAIRTIRPKYCFLENVPALAVSRYYGTVLGDLAEAGYDIKWRILSAAEMGAPHKCDRLWIMANAESNRDNRNTGKLQKTDELKKEKRPKKRIFKSDNASKLSDSECNRRGKMELRNEGRKINARSASKIRECFIDRGRSCWWDIEPGMGRVADGVAHRVDRLKAIGNGQVPIVAAEAWQLLSGGA